MSHFFIWLVGCLIISAIFAVANIVGQLVLPTFITSHDLRRLLYRLIVWGLVAVAGAIFFLVAWALNL
jgi:hypothetical protein